MLRRTLKRRARKAHSLAMQVCLELGNYRDMSKYNYGDECYRGEYRDEFISIEFSNETHDNAYCSISDSLGTVYVSHVNTLLTYRPGEWEKHLKQVGRIAEDKRREYKRAVVGEINCTVKGRPYYTCSSEIYI